MSTKAYEGLRFRTRSLSSLVTQLTQAFVELDRLAQAHEARFVANHASEEHDKDWLGWKRDTTGNIGAPSEFSRYASRAWREMKKRQREVKASGLRDPGVDSLVEIQVWLGPGKHLYGYVHSEVKGVREHLISAGIADDFAYWNNTDRDENVTTAQWRHRGRVWDQLLDGKCGKSFQFLSAEQAWPDSALVVAALPSLNRRARELAETLVYPVWAQETASAELTAQNMGSTVIRFMRECKSEAGPWRDRFEEQVRQLEAELPALSLG